MNPKHDSNVSGKKLSWFHCGHCGSFFQSDTAKKFGRRCSNCGFDPNPISSLENKSSIPFTKSIPNLKSGIGQHAKRQSALDKPKNRNFGYSMLKIMAAWMLFIGLLIFGANMIWVENKPKETTDYEEKLALIAQQQDAEFLRESQPSCKKTLIEFLSTTLPEVRSQFVISPITAVMRMTRYKDISSIISLDSMNLDDSQWAVVRIGDEQAIESTWKDKNGKRYEAFFRKHESAWLLDWEHFTRYSDMPFSVFLAENGDAEGEFRLLARERLAEERKNMSTISVVFYSPTNGRLNETGMQSPEFLVERNSPEGRLLLAAFDALKRKERPFGAKEITQDPESMIRTRVKIRRSGEQDTRKFQLVELKACHWYSSDKPGFEVGKGTITNH